MSRSPVALQWLGLTTLVMLMVAFAWLLMTPVGADAQGADPAVVTVTAAPADGEGVIEAVVAVDPGTTTLAGLTAAVHFDPERLVFAGCAVSEAGACNHVGDGTVKFSVFDLAGFDANSALFTATFVARSPNEEPAPLRLEVVEAIDRQAGALDGVVSR